MFQFWHQRKGEAQEMKCKEKYKMEIQELTLCGYTQDQIAKKLNISISTVKRTLRKLRESSSQWLTNLAERDMANIFRESLEGFKQDMMRLNELLEDPSVENDIKLQLQIRKEINHIRSKYLEHLLRGPMVWSMAVFTKKYSPEPIEHPTMNSLGGISGV